MHLPKCESLRLILFKLGSLSHIEIFKFRFILNILQTSNQYRLPIWYIEVLKTKVDLFSVHLLMSACNTLSILNGLIECSIREFINYYILLKQQISN